MTEQEEREKVIMGIQHEMDYGRGKCGQYCSKGKETVACRYDEKGLCIQHWGNDALALLKAQEPSEDWISRKRLKDEIQYYIEEAGWGEEINKALGWCLEFIDNQEAVKWE